MRSLLFVIILSAIVVLSGCDEGQSKFGISARDEQIGVDRLRYRAIDIVRDGLVNENAIVRSSAVEVVSTTGTKELMPIVTNLLKDEFAAVRFTAAVAIGDVKYSPGEYAVKRLLNDKDGNAKIAAAYALTKLGKGNFSDVVYRATENKDQTVRANAALLLGKLGDKKNVQLLYRVLRDSDSTDKVRLQAVEAIAMLGDEEIYQSKLWPLLISKYADDRVMGIRGMGALNTTDARNAIKTMLYDDVQEVRLCAADELGRIGDASGEAEVIEYLKKISRNPDESSMANSMATMAIGRIGGEVLTKLLPGLLQSRSKLIRLNAAQSVLLLTR
jgi:HEAT repeat protein